MKQFSNSRILDLVSSLDMTTSVKHVELKIDAFKNESTAMNNLFRNTAGSIRSASMDW